MRTMNLSELTNRQHRYFPANKHQHREQNEWHIDVYDAPFDFIHISTSAKELTQVSSIDKIAERFIDGGGDVVRSKLEIPGVGALITCADSVGHRFSFIEEESCQHDMAE